MAEMLRSPAVIPSPGTPPKTITEHVGRVATGTDALPWR